MTLVARLHRPGIGAWLRLIQAEARMVIRDTAGLLVPLGMPLLILTMQAVSIDEADQPLGRGLTVLDVYVLPIVLVMVITMSAVLNMPSFLATYRQTRLLRRIAVTPASPSMVLGAQIIVSFLQISIGIAAALLLAGTAFGAQLPLHLPAAILAVLAICAAMYAIGMVVASISPTPNASVAWGLVTFLGLGALGGMFGPVENLPGALASIGSWLPFGAGVDALQAAWLGESVPWESWLSLGVTTVLGTVVSALLFRWE